MNTTNFDFLLSLFNQYLVTDARNNLSSLKYYFNTNPATSGNTLIGSMLDAIRDYPLESMDLPLFNSILDKERMNPQEKQTILNDLMRWKSYDFNSISPMKKHLANIVASTTIAQANSKFSDDPMGYLNYLKNAQINLDKSDCLNSLSFDKVDINSIVAGNKCQKYKSAHDWINTLFVEDCLDMNQMILVSMPPGCMSGDTEVFLENGEVKTLEELYKRGKENFKIYSISEEGCILDIAENIQISKYVDSWYVIETEKKNFKVTEDHPFYVYPGTWKKAEELNEKDILIGVDINTMETLIGFEILSVKKEKLDTPQPVYDVVNAGVNHNYAVRIHENLGIFSHNTGKSLFMLGEAIHMATTTNYKALYLVLGDLGWKDIIIRAGAILTGMSFKESNRNLNEIYSLLKSQCGNRLEFSVNPAGTVKTEDIVEYVMANGFNAVFIDYDSNLKMDSSQNSSMYLDYGNVYNELTKLTLNGILVFIASQPNKLVWGEKILGMKDIGESAKKSMIVDMVIIGSRGKNHTSFLNIAKNRRGITDKVFASIRLNNGRFRVLPKDLVEHIAEGEEKEYTNTEIDEMLRIYENSRSSFGYGGSAAPRGKVANPFK